MDEPENVSFPLGLMPKSLRITGREQQHQHREIFCGSIHSRMGLTEEKGSSFRSCKNDSSAELKYKGQEHQIGDLFTRINDSLDSHQECFYVLNSIHHLSGPQSVLIIIICLSLLWPLRELVFQALSPEKSIPLPLLQGQPTSLSRDGPPPDPGHSCWQLLSGSNWPQLEVQMAHSLFPSRVSAASTPSWYLCH